MSILKILFKEELKNYSYLTQENEIYQCLLKNYYNREEIIHRVQDKIKIPYFGHENYHLFDFQLFSLFDKNILLVKQLCPLYKKDDVVYFVSSGLQTTPVSLLLKHEQRNHHISNFKSHILYFKFGFEFEELIHFFSTSSFENFPVPVFEKETVELKNETKPEMKIQEKNTTFSESQDAVLLVEDIIKKGLQYRASDIHIEPLQDGVKIRYRIDGLLLHYKDLRLNTEQKNALVNRFKILSSMDIGEKRKAQDGKISNFIFNNKQYDFRISSVATVHGEKLVLRVFEKTNAILSLDELGFSQSVSSQLKESIKSSQGIIFITGATGSGKTTTLHSLLNELDSERLNIYTIEDPVERTIPNINQICVKETGISFDEHLVSLLRQDPNVMVIGEIRDQKTAKLAVEASLTGHLVLSTLHTNGVFETFERLLNLNIESYQLSASLIGVCSQKLVRKLCVSCSHLHVLTEKEQEILEVLKQKSHPKYHYLFDLIKEKSTRSKGCEKCNMTGFYGRTVISDFVTVSEDIKTKLNSNRLEKEDISSQELYIPMNIDALEKISEGIVSLDEVIQILI